MADRPLILVPMISGSHAHFETISETVREKRGEVYTVEESLELLRLTNGYGPAEPGEDELAVLAEFQTTLQAAEEAFYEMDYERAEELLSGREIVGYQRAFEAYAQYNERIDWVQRGYIVRFRVLMALDRREEAVALAKEAVSVFPDWEPSRSVLPPSLYLFFLEIRDLYLLEQESVLFRTPYEHCSVYFNGSHIAAGQRVHLPQTARGGAVGLSCVEGEQPFYWVWHEPFPPEVFLEPIFYFTGETVSALLHEEELNMREREVFLRDAMTQIFPDYDLLILFPDGRNEDSVWMYFLGRDSGRTVFTGTHDSVSLSARERRRTQIIEHLLDASSVEPDRLRESRLKRAMWGLLGAGGAGTIMAVTAAIIEANAYEIFQDCEQDSNCRGGPEMGLYRRRGEAASSWATSGSVLGIGSAVSVGILWLLSTRGQNRLDRLTRSQTNRFSIAVYRFDVEGDALEWGIYMSAVY